MNRFQAVLVTGLAAAILAFGSLSATHADSPYERGEPSSTPTGLDGPAIVGGDPAEPGAWPAQVSVQRRSGPGWSHICGGTLIDAEWAMTAAHCIISGDPASFRIVVGRYLIGSGTDGVEVTPDEVIVHPDYDTSNNHNDIAVFHLSDPVAGETSVLGLPDDADLWAPGVTAMASGWGRLASGGASPDELMEVAVPIISDADCEDAYAILYPGAVDGALNVCAGDLENGGIDTCQGDSGGPLWVRDSSGKDWIQAGITSWGEGCAEPGYPGVYAQVSAQIGWLEEATGLDIDGDGGGGGGDGIDLFEGWNPVANWPGPDIAGVAGIISYLDDSIDPPVWDTIAFYSKTGAGMWLTTYADAPLPSFNTLTVLEAGETYWLFVTQDAVYSEDPTPPEDLIADGGFELGTPNPEWEESSTAGDTPLCDSSCPEQPTNFAHAGDWWSWFGGWDVDDLSSVSQEVIIPEGEATLSFWFWAPIIGGTGQSYLSVMIDGAEIERIEEEDTGPYRDAYVLITLDVSSYADGEDHLIEFVGETFPSASDVTSYFVDDVSLEVE